MHTGEIQTLVRIDRTTVDNARSDTWRTNVHREELDQSIVDEYAIAYVNVIGEVIVGDGDLAFALEPFVHEHEIFARLYVNSSGNIAHAYSRTLKVTEYRDGRPELICHAPHERDRLDMLRVRTVRKVQAGDVHARLDE
jgi:hypothetical protein